MKAVLLVGGMGTRLRPLTYRIPKPLVPVMGKPLIMHVVDSLPAEVDEIIVPVSYKKDVMEAYLRRNPPKRKITLVDEPQPLGTGGAVKNVEDYIDGTFLVINGDSLWSLDLTEFVRFHRQRKGVASISLWEVDDPSPFGIADIDENGRIRRFQEKPKREEAFSKLINAGAYALEREVLDYIGEGFVSMEREIFPKLLGKGMYGMRFEGYWIDCGTRESLLAAFWTLMEDRTVVEKDSVADGASIEGPVVIGHGAVVPGTKIGPRAYISDRSVIGLRSCIERSVVYEDARIGTRCTIKDSVIDQGVTIPDGSVIESKIVSNATGET
jgi:mannose-1-phosphate guanylyltransferase